MTRARAVRYRLSEVMTGLDQEHTAWRKMVVQEMSSRFQKFIETEMTFPDSAVVDMKGMVKRVDMSKVVYHLTYHSQSYQEPKLKWALNNDSMVHEGVASADYSPSADRITVYLAPRLGLDRRKTIESFIHTTFIPRLEMYLTHELIHRQQELKRGTSVPFPKISPQQRKLGIAFGKSLVRQSPMKYWGQSQYIAQPEEIASFANQFAEFAVNFDRSDRRTQEDTLAEFQGIIADLSAGAFVGDATPAYKQFMKQFILNLQHRGIPSGQIHQIVTKFIGSANK